MLVSQDEQGCCGRRTTPALLATDVMAAEVGCESFVGREKSESSQRRMFRGLSGFGVHDAAGRRES